MIVDFKKRVATTHIIILIKDTSCINYSNFYKQCRRRGELDAGVHYFIDDDGTIIIINTKNDIPPNPSTGDNIIKLISIFGISILGLIITTLLE